MHAYYRNIGDYHKKAGRLTMLQHGAYMLLTDACYDREIFPTEEDAIEWAWASTDEEEAAVKFVLKKFFSLGEDGRYTQKRISEELDKYKLNGVKNRIIAISRESFKAENYEKKEAFDNLLSEVKLEIKNDSLGLSHEACTQRVESLLKKHECPPNHKPETINQKPETNNPIIRDKPKRFIFKKELQKLGIDEEWIDHWLIVRKNKKAANSKAALKLIETEAQKAGITIQEAILFAAKEGWASFKHTWMLNKISGDQVAAAKPRVGSIESLKDYGEDDFFEQPSTGDYIEGEIL